MNFFKNNTTEKENLTKKMAALAAEKFVRARDAFFFSSRMSEKKMRSRECKEFFGEPEQEYGNSEKRPLSRPMADSSPWEGKHPRHCFGGVSHRGFTLLETLFSILIFSAALVALMTIAGRGINAADSANQETVAHYLAQEGLETVRNIRDSNYDADANGGTVAWDSGISQCVGISCQVAYGSGSSAPTLEPCAPQNPMCIVYENVSSGTFVDAGGSATPSEYTRTITVTPQPSSSPNEYDVVSTVRWTSKTIPQVVSLETILKNWQTTP